VWFVCALALKAIATKKKNIKEKFEKLKIKQRKLLNFYIFEKRCLFLNAC